MIPPSLVSGVTRSVGRNAVRSDVVVRNATLRFLVRVRVRVVLSVVRILSLKIHRGLTTTMIVIVLKSVKSVLPLGLPLTRLAANRFMKTMRSSSP
jgi:hypothetical protein